MNCPRCNATLYEDHITDLETDIFCMACGYRRMPTAGRELGYVALEAALTSNERIQDISRRVSVQLVGSGNWGRVMNCKKLERMAR
jgi:DNA-directed RNA polymerase subunit RPC12/RpoP